MSEIKVNYSTFSSKAESADASTQFTTTGYDGGNDYSYIAVRSINMAGKDGLHSSVFDHDYRLMAFEFQDYYNAAISFGDIDSATDDVYQVAVRFSDNTIESVKSIIQSYSDMMNLLSGYQEESMENCNYGNISEQFNPHFITAMTERYADDLNSAPWVQAPLIFAMHRDLLYDDFGGDKQKIAEFAASKSVQISPAAGTPTDIEDFYINSIEALWDKYYSTDGIIGQLLSSVGEDEKKILLTQEYTELPEIVVADSVSEYFINRGKGLRAGPLALSKDISRNGNYYTQLDTENESYTQNEWTLDVLDLFGFEIYEDLETWIGVAGTPYNITKATEAISNMLTGITSANINGYGDWQVYAYNSMNNFYNQETLGDLTGTDVDLYSDVFLKTLEEFGYGYAANPPADAAARLSLNEILYLLRLRDDL